MADSESLPAALTSLATLWPRRADPSHLVVDLYVSWPDAPADSDELADGCASSSPTSAVLRSAAG